MITPDQIMAFEPCLSWTRERITGLIGNGVEPARLTEILIESVEPDDARWLVAHLLSQPDKITWAADCAKRVSSLRKKGYSDASIALNNTDDAADAAGDAAVYAADVANAADPAEAAAYAAITAGDAATYAANATSDNAITDTASAAYINEYIWQIQHARDLLSWETL